MWAHCYMERDPGNREHREVRVTECLPHVGLHWQDQASKISYPGVQGKVMLEGRLSFEQRKKGWGVWSISLTSTGWGTWASSVSRGYSWEGPHQRKPKRRVPRGKLCLVVSSNSNKMKWAKVVHRKIHLNMRDISFLAIAPRPWNFREKMLTGELLHFSSIVSLLFPSSQLSQLTYLDMLFRVR